MNLTEKLVIGGLLLAAAGLIAMNLTATSAYESLSGEIQDQDRMPPRVAPVYAHTTRMQLPPVSLTPEEVRSYDALGLSDDERSRVTRVMSVQREGILAAWRDIPRVGKQEAMRRAHEVMMAAEADLRRELGDKWPAYEQQRAERMGIARSTDASVD